MRFLLSAYAAGLGSSPLRTRACSNDSRKEVTDMAYRTPELVLIGAAQNLVLDVASLQEQCRFDNPIGDSFPPELW
jgi:hypothetical protein